MTIREDETLSIVVHNTIQYNKQKETRKLANLPMRGGSYVGHKDKRNTT